MAIKNAKGFTLIELLLYVGLFSVIVGSLSLVFSQLVTQKLASNAYDEIHQQGYWAVQYIKDEVESSALVQTPISGATGSTLVLTKTTPAENPTTITLTAGKILVQKGSAASVDLTGDMVTVSNLSFRNLANPATKDNVRFTFTISMNGKTKEFISTASRK